MRKEKITNQRKINQEKNGSKVLQKPNDGSIQIKKQVRSYVEPENKLKALEEKGNKKSD